MNMSSIRYLFKEGFRSIWQNRLMAIASVGVLVSCLLLSGGAYLILANIDHSFDWVYSQNVAVAFAKEDTTKEQTQVIQDKLESLNNVSGVEFISKDKYLEKYKGSIPDDVYEKMKGKSNPYLDSFVITFKDLKQFDDTIKQIKQIPQIDSTSYNADIAKTLANIRWTVFWVGMGIILLLLVVSLFIIGNTIKLTVYNRRLEISIMKSVGATNWFVRIPFIIEGVVLGIVSGLVSYILIGTAYIWLYNKYGASIFGGLVSFSSVWYVILLGFFAIGTLTGLTGCVISMNKYLRNEGGISNVL